MLTSEVLNIQYYTLMFFIFIYFFLFLRLSNTPLLKGVDKEDLAVKFMNNSAN